MASPLETVRRTLAELLTADVAGALHNRAVRDALRKEEADEVATIALEDADPWTGQRGAWANELRAYATRLVEHLALTFTPDELAYFKGEAVHAGWGESRWLAAFEHGRADMRHGEPEETPDGAALWLDVRAADFLATVAEELGNTDLAEQARGSTLEAARRRWTAAEATPDALTPTPMGEAAAAAGFPGAIQGPTRKDDLWHLWLQGQAPAGEPQERPPGPGSGLGGRRLDALVEVRDDSGQLVELNTAAEGPASNARRRPGVASCRSSRTRRFVANAR